jgi:hypothetical protein
MIGATSSSGPHHGGKGSDVGPTMPRGNFKMMTRQQDKTTETAHGSQ